MQQDPVTPPLQVPSVSVTPPTQVPNVSLAGAGATAEERIAVGRLQKAFVPSPE